MMIAAWKGGGWDDVACVKNWPSDVTEESHFKPTDTLLMGGRALLNRIVSFL